MKGLGLLAGQKNLMMSLLAVENGDEQPSFVGRTNCRCEPVPLSQSPIKKK